MEVLKSMENSIVFIYQKVVDLVAVLPKWESPRNLLMAVFFNTCVQRVLSKMEM